MYLFMLAFSLADSIDQNKTNIGTAKLETIWLNISHYRKEQIMSVTKKNVCQNVHTKIRLKSSLLTINH